MKAQIQIPKKLIPVFMGKARYRTSKGGRGSAKTRTFALMTAIRAYQFAEAGRRGVILCGREFMNSLDESSMEEVKEAIRSVDWLNDYFDIGEKFIRTKNGRIKYVFSGLRHNLDSIKSKAKILIAWLDEAESISEAAYKKLIPTVREPDSEIWITWNPEKEGSPTDKRFVKSSPENHKHAHMNWSDNPFFPEVLNNERLSDKETMTPEDYAHVWEGDYLTISDAQVLKGKWRVQSFEPQDHWLGPYFGADWGYSNDPSTLIRFWIEETAEFKKKMYIEYEAYGRGVDTNQLPQLFDTVPESRDYIIRADSNRPEIISAMNNAGFQVRGATKGAGSVESGVTWLRGLDEIVIHERCKHTKKEAKTWSYKVDKLTGDVLPVLKKGNDHTWDGVRYGASKFIPNKKKKNVFIGRA